jgi:ankyrin repeat protein
MAEQYSVGSDLVQLYVNALDAIKTGDLPTLSELLRKHPQLSYYRAQRGRTLLNQLADWPGHWPRRLESAALLIDAGADVNACTGETRDGETTLQWAVSCNDAALTDLLIEAGAPVDGLNGDRRPMMQALFYESGDAALVLIRHGATLDLESAAGLGRIDLLPTFFDAEGKLMSDAGTHHAPVTNPIPFNDSDVFELLEQAIVYASINGKADAAGYLIDHGADVNAEPSGFTHKMPPVAWARHHPDMVDFLVQRGARR